jgi:uncharacterized lipoprotein
MHTRATALVLTVLATLVTAACGSYEAGRPARQQPVYLASSEPLTFSPQKPRRVPLPVTRQDLAMARADNWRGEPITVNTEQILVQ